MNKNTFTTWMKEQFTRDNLKKIIKEGAFTLPEFDGYSRTSRLYAVYKEDIWEIVRLKAEKRAYANVMAWFATFTDVVLVNQKHLKVNLFGLRRK